MSAAPAAGVEGAIVNLPAILIVLAITALLVIGVRESARFNAVIVADQACGHSLFHHRRRRLREARELVPVHAVRVRWRHRQPRRSSFLPTLDSTPCRPRQKKRRIRAAIFRSASSPRWSSARSCICRSPASSAGSFRWSSSRRTRSSSTRRLATRWHVINQGLGRRSRVRRRGRRHHERAARHAAQPAAHLLRDEPRPAPASRREQGPPQVPHALHHDDDYGRRSSPSSPDSRRSTSSAR